MKKEKATGITFTKKAPVKHFLLITRTTFVLLFTCLFCGIAEARDVETNETIALKTEQQKNESPERLSMKWAPDYRGKRHRGRHDQWNCY